MPTGLASQGSRKLIAGILLIALACRALEICPDGFPTQLLHYVPAHGHGMHHSGGASHPHGASRSEHCVFAAVASAGPATHTLVVHLPLDNSLPPLFDAARSAFRTQRFRIQQPRAPPVPA